MPILKITLASLLLAATLFLAIVSGAKAQVVPAQNQIIPSAYFGDGYLISTSTSATHKLGATLVDLAGSFITGILGVSHGGTGSSTLAVGKLLYGAGTSAVQAVGTTTVSCGGTASCTSFTVIGDTPITITGSGGGGGGSGNVATSTTETAGFLSYWTSTGATPATLGKVATTTLTLSSFPATLSGTLGKLVGGIDTSWTWWGLSTTTQPASSNLLVSNGSNGVYGVATSTLTASSPLTGSFTQIGSGGALGCQTASGSQAGCLSSTDWNTFNNKQASLSFTYPLVNSANTVSLAFGTTTSNTWAGTQTFAYASSTGWSSSYASSTSGYFGTLTLPNLGTAAGAFLAVNGSGQVISTTTPSSGGTPGGASSTIQYNANGAFAGNSNLTYNGTQLGLGSIVSDGFLTVDANTAGVGSTITPLIVRAQSGLGTNIFEIQNSAGSNIVWVNQFGHYHGVLVAASLGQFTTNSVNNTPLVVSGLNGQNNETATFDSGQGHFYVDKWARLALGTTTTPWMMTIGTTSAGSLFKGGQLALTDTNAGANLKHWVFASEGGNFYLSTSSDAYATSSVPRLAITSTGNVGVGTSSPTSLLSLAAGSAATPVLTFGDTLTGLFRSGLNALGWAISGVEKATLTSTGFGLSSTTPSYLLSVGNYFGINGNGVVVPVEQRSATSTTATLDWATSGASVLYQTGSAATSIYLTNATTSQYAGSRKMVTVCNPSSSAGALTWVGAEWAGGTAPAQTTTANQCDVYSFFVTAATSTSATPTYKVFGAMTPGFQ